MTDPVGGRGSVAEAGDRLSDALLPSPREDHDLSGLLRRLVPTDAEVDRLDRQPQAPVPAQRGDS